MEVSELAAIQVAGTAALTQQAASMAMLKTAAEMQMQMAKIIDQQAAAVNPPEGFSVYG